MAVFFIALLKGRAFCTVNGARGAVLMADLRAGLASAGLAMRVSAGVAAAFFGCASYQAKQKKIKKKKKNEE